MSLKSLLDSAFGHSGKEIRGGEAMYYCPKCNHHKPKLSVNLETHNWKCWVCYRTNKTAGKSIRTLFKLLKVPKKYYTELERYTKKRIQYKVEDIDEILRLPDEFLPLWKNHHNFEHNHALHYLKSRGITAFDILKYGIGYCRDGEYKNRIIIPSFDGNGELNYFTSRTWIKDHPLKYKNPKVSKDVIGFELMINWDLPIYLVEGTFDAIAIRRNSIPLFGKTIPKKLKLKIIEKEVKEVFVILDDDAISDAVADSEELARLGVDVRLVTLSGKDPSDLGYKKTHQLINSAPKYNFGSSIFTRLALI